MDGPYEWPMLVTAMLSPLTAPARGRQTEP